LSSCFIQFCLNVADSFSPGNVWTPMWDSLATLEGDGREDMITGGENAQVLSSVALRGCSCY